MIDLPKLLIVDDDQSVCETLKIALSANYTVISANSYEEAKQKLLENAHDLFFLVIDYWMGERNGKEFFKQEVLKLGRKIPAILISGFIGQHQTGAEKQEIDSLFDKVIEKPFNIFEVKTFIESYLK